MKDDNTPEFFNRAKAYISTGYLINLRNEEKRKVDFNEITKFIKNIDLTKVIDFSTLKNYLTSVKIKNADNSLTQLSALLYIEKTKISDETTFTKIDYAKAIKLAESIETILFKTEVDSVGTISNLLENTNSFIIMPAQNALATDSMLKYISDNITGFGKDSNKDFDSAKSLKIIKAISNFGNDQNNFSLNKVEANIIPLFNEKDLTLWTSIANKKLTSENRNRTFVFDTIIGFEKVPFLKIVNPGNTTYNNTSVDSRFNEFLEIKPTGTSLEAVLNLMNNPLTKVTGVFKPKTLLDINASELSDSSITNGLEDSLITAGTKTSFLSASYFFSPQDVFHSFKDGKDFLKKYFQYRTNSRSVKKSSYLKSVEEQINKVEVNNDEHRHQVEEANGIESDFSSAGSKQINKTNKEKKISNEQIIVFYKKAANNLKTIKSLEEVYSGFNYDKTFLTETAVFTNTNQRAEMDDLVNAKDSNYSPAHILFMAGPDWLDNDFDLTLVYSKKADFSNTNFDPSTIKPWDNLKNTLVNIGDNIFDVKCFVVRIANVNFPFPVTTVKKVNFLSQEISLVGSKVDYNNSAKLNFRLDQNLFFLEWIDKLVGRKEFFKSKPTKDDFKNTLNVGLIRNFNLNYRLDIKINPHYFTRNVDDETLSDALTTNEGIQRDNFIFEDVKFLGNSSDIELGNDSSERAQANFDFIFKKSYFLKKKV
jgi:hypothetical protein